MGATDHALKELFQIHGCLAVLGNPGQHILEMHFKRFQIGYLIADEVWSHPTSKYGQTLDVY